MYFWSIFKPFEWAFGFKYEPEMVKFQKSLSPNMFLIACINSYKKPLR